MPSTLIANYKDGLLNYMYFMSQLSYYIRSAFLSDEQLLEILDHLYTQGMDINLVSRYGMTGFHTCAYMVCMSVCRWYLAHGADPNICGNRFYLQFSRFSYLTTGTPLINVINTRDIPLLTMCLDAGVSLKESPIYYVFKNMRGDTYDYILRQLDVLLKYGAPVSKEELSTFMTIYNGYDADDDFFYSCIEDEYDDIIEDFAREIAIKMVKRYLRSVPNYAALRIQKATRKMLTKVREKHTIVGQCIQSYIRSIIYHPDYTWKDGKTTLQKFKPTNW